MALYVLEADVALALGCSFRSGSAGFSGLLFIVVVAVAGAYDERQGHRE